MVAFAQAALPWVCVAVSVAVACVILVKRINKKK